MAPRRRASGSDGSVSSIYAKIGPSPGAALRVCRGDPVQADRLIRDWRAWRQEYGDRWDGGDRLAPAPPHHELFGYARPT